ncbi:MAG: hypothetical protein CMN03_09755 [Roseibacillus sp.]|nr:hypothetical protein [Roseibacillus sp.]
MILKPRGIRPRYVSKVLNAAYLAPAIKRAILQGTQPPEFQAQDLLVSRSMDWEAQMSELGIPSVGGGQ